MIPGPMSRSGGWEYITGWHVLDPDVLPALHSKVTCVRSHQKDLSSLFGEVGITQGILECHLNLAPFNYIYIVPFYEATPFMEIQVD